MFEDGKDNFGDMENGFSMEPEDNEQFEQKVQEGEEINEEEEELFDGVYEEYKEREVKPDFNYESILTDFENYNSEIIQRRQQLYKIVITRPKREFNEKVIFSEKAPGEESSGANSDIKQLKANEYPMTDRAVLEVGLQTENKSSKKAYQVPKMRIQNAFTQVEPGMSDIIDKFESKANFYLSNPQKLNEIENFLHKIRNRVEEALQSNETIDIFQNDFDLDRSTQIQMDPDKKGEKQIEMRTFRDNLLAGQKSKKEKMVNHIRFLREDEVYLAHSLIRNLQFEDKTKVLGIPFPTQILFWNFKDHEINSPVFFLDVPMEITSFEFCPTNSDKLVCGLFSGQLIIFEINDLLGILHRSSDSESVSLQKKSIFFINN
jgi:hypothetical protein